MKQLKIQSFNFAKFNTSILKDKINPQLRFFQDSLKDFILFSSSNEIVIYVPSNNLLDIIAVNNRQKKNIKIAKIGTGLDLSFSAAQNKLFSYFNTFDAVEKTNFTSMALSSIQLEAIQPVKIDDNDLYFLDVKVFEYLKNVRERIFEKQKLKSANYKYKIEINDDIILSELECFYQMIFCQTATNLAKLKKLLQKEGIQHSINSIVNQELKYIYINESSSPTCQLFIKLIRQQGVEAKNMQFWPQKNEDNSTPEIKMALEELRAINDGNPAGNLEYKYVPAFLYFDKIFM